MRLLVRDPRKIQAKAYRQAGYRPADNEIAASLASRLMGKARVRAAYDALLAEYQEVCVITEAQILAELAKVAFADPREMLNAEGRLKPLHELSDEAVAALKELKVERTRGIVPDGGGPAVVEELVEVKLHDKQVALRTLAQAKGMLTTKVEHTGLPNWEQVVGGAK